MKASQKILITIDWFLPGTKSGGPVRSYANLIEHLDEGFEFLVITRNNDFGSKDSYDGITPNVWTRFNDYTKVFYCSSDFLNRSNLKNLLMKTDFDVAYVNGIYSWYFSILPVMLLKDLHRPIIVSARGMLNPQAFTVKPFKKNLFLKLAKLLNLYNDITFHATNNEEASYIVEIVDGIKKVQVAPNLPRKLTALLEINTIKHDPIRFVNLARISIEKGTLKMLKAMTHITSRIILDLYGPIHDEAYWEKCQLVITKLHPQVEVNYRGVIESEYVPALLCKYDFFILLSEGENFGHAILEALSVGLPVIISKSTPWTNLTAQSVGWDVNLNNENDIRAVFDTAVRMSDEKYKMWSDAALAYSKKIIENPKVLEQNKALFLNA